MVKTIVQFETVSDESKQASAAKGIEIISYQEFLERGKETHHEPTPSQPDALSYVMYTSGTTGNPKVRPVHTFARLPTSPLKF